MMTNRKWILLIVLLLVLTIAALLIVRFMLPGGSTVVVTVNGEPYGAYSLYEERTITIAPPDGSWHNTLQIRGGTAAVIESDCSNQICVHTPPLTDDSFGIIVCLPHGVVVECKDK